MKRFIFIIIFTLFVSVANFAAPAKGSSKANVDLSIQAEEYITTKTRIVKLKAAKADEVAVVIRQALSKYGNIQINEERNFVIITDIPEMINDLTELARALDLKNFKSADGVKTEVIYLNYVHPDTIDYSLNGIVPMKIDIETEFFPAEVKIDELLPSNVLTLYASGNPQIQNNEFIEWIMSLPIDTKVSLFYAAKMLVPDNYYNFITDPYIKINFIWFPMEDIEKEIYYNGNVEEFKNDLISELDNLDPENPQERNHIKNAIKILENINLNPETNNELKHELLKLLDVIDHLSAVQSLDLKEERIKVDKIMQALESKWKNR